MRFLNTLGRMTNGEAVALTVAVFIGMWFVATRLMDGAHWGIVAGIVISAVAGIVVLGRILRRLR
jgi:hypothetical protein